MADSKSSRIALAAALLIAFVVAVQFFLRSQEAAEALAEARKRIDTALTIDHDAGRALHECAEALKAHADDPELRVLQGLCYHALKRYTDAIEAFDRARTHSQDPAEDGAVDFYQARALIRRFLATGDRGDLNLAEVRFDGSAGGPFDAARDVLLGLAYARPSDVQDRDKAKVLLRPAVAGGEIEGLDDPDGARRVAKELGL